MARRASSFQCRYGDENRATIHMMRNLKIERVALAAQSMGIALRYGYTRDYPVERLLRDAILLSIRGGTIEVMRKNITRDLALQYR